MPPLYFYHLKKCGGSTMNAWLDSLSSTSRIWNPAWNKNNREDWFFPRPGSKPAHEDTAGIRSLFYWCEVVHSHASLRNFVLPGTFCFTMLRDPVRRLVSQITDWRRLTPADFATKDPAIRDGILDCQQLSLHDYLARHGYGTGRMHLNNYLTRALATTRLGHEVVQASNAAALLPEALRSLHEDYDFIGISDEFDLSRNALCALAGLPPAGTIPWLNKSVPEGAPPDPSLALTAADIEEFTGCDAILYASARRLFDQRYRAIGEAYTSAHFEQRHAATLLAQLRGEHAAGATRHSIKSPFYGAGFHGRDGAGTDQTAVWTGPGRRATLYIPVPDFMNISLLLWIRGYAAAAQRESLRISVNGIPTPHHFEPAAGYADLLVVNALSETSFARLDIDLDETCTTGNPGDAVHDIRQRGVSFDAYGWREA